MHKETFEGSNWQTQSRNQSISIGHHSVLLRDHFVVLLAV
jgi:hypothetical protein